MATISHLKRASSIARAIPPYFLIASPKEERFLAPPARLSATVPTHLRASRACTRNMAQPRPNPGHIAPGTLPGTPKTFSIASEKLIDLAKTALYDHELGRKKPDILSPDFRFEFPIVKLDKKGYLDAVKTFDFYGGFPNYDQNAYDWRVDKYEPQRVWFTIRVSATHTGTLKVFKFTYKPTGKKVLGAPECYSMTFNEDGKVTSITGGYVMDNRVGNTNKLGGLFGILQGLGIFVPHPQPGTLGWRVGCTVDTAVNFVRETLHFFTLGLFRAKEKLK